VKGEVKTPGARLGSSLWAKRVVNTRSAGQASELDALLRERGVFPLSYPCIDIVPPSDPAGLDRALEDLSEGRFDWLVFTSANAVRAVADAYSRRTDRRRRSDSLLEMTSGALVRPAVGPDGTRILVAAVGPGTARAVRLGLALEVDLEPGVYEAETLAGELLSRRPERVLLPLSEQARDVLPQALKTVGVDVATVAAYRTVTGTGGVDLPRLLRHGEVDAVMFTSPSTVDNLAVRLEKEKGEWSDLKGVCIACIGPVTSRATAEKGLPVQVQPEEHTLRGMVEALETFFREASSEEGDARGSRAGGGRAGGGRR
jgi:uroporphyrinogen III methyltransferase/synthase